MKKTVTVLKFIFSIVFAVLCMFSFLMLFLSLGDDDTSFIIFLGVVAALFFAITVLLARSARKELKKGPAVSPEAELATTPVPKAPVEPVEPAETVAPSVPAELSVPAEPADPRSYTTARQRFGKYELLSGLNMPTGTTCKVVAAGDKLVISALKQEYTLPNRKIIGVDIQTIKDFQKQYVSSVGGAVAGGVLLGPLGAILGGMAKQKIVKNTTPLLIVTYEKEPGDIQYIVFKLPPNGSYFANGLVSAYKRPTKNIKTSIEL